MTFKKLNLRDQLKTNYDQFISGFSIEQYLDKCSNKIRGLIVTTLNPMLIDPIESSFEYGFWFIKFTADLLLNDIKVYDLTNIERSGTPSIKYQDKNIQISWKMLFPEIEVTSRYDLNARNLTRHGEIKAKITNLLAYVDMRYDLQNLQAKLHDIKLETKRLIDVEVNNDVSADNENFSLQRWTMGSAVINVLANLCKGKIMHSIEDAIKESVEEALKDIKLNK